MARPQTCHEMLRTGYKRLSTGQCSSCSAAIEWWLTTNNKKLPILVQASAHAEIIVHFARECKEQGSNAYLVKPAAPAQRPSVGQRDQLALDLQRLLESSSARAVTLIDNEGLTIYAYRNGLDPEDIRLDLITAANAVRTALREGAKHGNQAQ